MLDRDNDNRALSRYAQVGRLFTGKHHQSDREAHQRLLALLTEWTEQLSLPRLSHYGVKQDDLALVVENSRGSSMKTNPVVLSDHEVMSILLSRI